MKVNINKRWRFLALEQCGWWLYEKEPVFVHNFEWLGDSEGQLYVAEGLFDLPKPEFDDEPKLFRRKWNSWIEVPKSQWKTNGGKNES